MPVAFGAGNALNPVIGALSSSSLSMPQAKSAAAKSKEKKAAASTMPITGTSTTFAASATALAPAVSDQMKSQGSAVKIESSVSKITAATGYPTALPSSVRPN
jgi:hypothetical protein